MPMKEQELHNATFFSPSGELKEKTVFSPLGEVRERGRSVSEETRERGNVFWIITLFAAEGIPSAIVTYVAILMFLQIEVQPAMATCYCGLLFLPWVLKSFMRSYVRRLGFFRRQLQWLELSIVALLMLLAFTFHTSSFTLLSSPFTLLFLLSLLTAWHELAARMYYERMLRPRLQRYYNRMKMLASQSAVILTYGFCIMLVGGLQVLYRRIPRSWNETCYLVAGIFLTFTLIHLFTLRRPSVSDKRQKGSPIDAVREEIRIIDRIRHQSGWRLCVFSLFLLLLPQSLMFYSRVLFLLAPQSEGGLGRSLIDVGFAQGTVGVIGFSIGLLLGRQLLFAPNKKQQPSMRLDGRDSHPYNPQPRPGFWWFAIPLGLSPMLYLLMTFEPPRSLVMLSFMTFLAQFMFGFGLNAILHFVRQISGERYRNTVNVLYIPLVAFVMLPSLAASGWLVTQLGFRHFFLLDALCAPLAWLFLYLKGRNVG